MQRETTFNGPWATRGGWRGRLGSALGACACLALVGGMGLGLGCGEDGGGAGPDLGEVGDADETGLGPDEVDGVTAETVDSEDGAGPDTQTPDGTDEADTSGEDAGETADLSADGEVFEVVEVRKPPAIALSVAQVPTTMNGSRPTVTPNGPLDYHLRVNRAGFELDVWVDGDIDEATLEVACSDDDEEPVAMPALERVGPSAWVARFGEAIAAPVATRMVCAGSVAGPLGTAEASYAFETADLPRELDPFPETDLWVVQLERDVFRLEVIDMPDGSVELRSARVAGGDGVDDFDAPFFELGLMSRTNTEAARAVREHLLRRVRGHVWAIYGLVEGRPVPGGVDIAILFEGDPEAPEVDAFDGGAGGFSRIALTGDGELADQVAGTFGRALIDWNNQRREDNAAAGLGVWPTALARGILRNSLGILLLEPYRPSQGGTAFGDHTDDMSFLGKDGDEIDRASLSADAAQRFAIYELVIDLGGMALASILAHEIGHSLGLVPFGAPPVGMFAGVRADFTVTLADDAHIDIEGLNVMQTGGNLDIAEAIGGERPAFEPLSWAYLRRQIVVGPAR